MEKEKENHLSVVRLTFKKGDLIVKEGDYGISIYKIIKGKLQIFTETDDVEVPLAVLGPGEIMGEMVFLDRDRARRSASARAIEDSELEVWHPKMLMNEYEQMPPILKHMADQALNRLVRMNKLIIQLTEKTRQREAALKKTAPSADRRRYFRKKVRLQFVCRPLDSPSKAQISGEIKNLSLGGVELEIKLIDVSRFSYKSGDRFLINTRLPNGKQLDFTAKIAWMSEGETSGTLSLGMSFTELGDQASKELGFFMMSA